MTPVELAKAALPTMEERERAALAASIQILRQVAIDNHGNVGCLGSSIDCVLRRLSALEAEGADGWRPIESAPRDGTRVLLSGIKHGPRVDVGEWGLGRYLSRTKGWQHAWITNPGNEVAPTHWMPLPSPPPVLVDGAGP